MVDPYDASEDGSWKSSFADSADPIASQLKKRVIDITETFDPETEILVRFRLYSNESVNGWGWSIDYLRIQSTPLFVPDHLVFKAQIYPNPIQNGGTMNLVFKAEKHGKVHVELRNISGQNILVSSFDVSLEGGKFQMSIPENLQGGLYFVDVRSEASNILEVHKILVVSN